MSKRKASAVEGDDIELINGHAKRPSTETNNGNSMLDRFTPTLFDPALVHKYAADYATSDPYKHLVVLNLINDALLRSVRTEILDNIHFTPKETDIYKIHQSGDLANLDGLDPAALAKLPSLLKLRDALYGAEFRKWVQDVSGAGALSGRKTDMAVNVYLPGGHLLCHDDVIGSRRPWKPEWGGALRLYATETKVDADGKTFKVPKSKWSRVIPPAWNQLSFFAVQPGESFHDVEEVYHPSEDAGEEDGGRFRMAISGWFHIPQDGEEGYEPGLEESMAKQSSLQQLQGKADQFDEPRAIWLDPAKAKRPDLHNARRNGASTKRREEDEAALSEADLDFLLQYMTPNYLTPDTVDELSDLFAEESTLQLTDFLSPKFATTLRAQFGGSPNGPLPESEYGTSRPPYKHRYQYLQPTTTTPPISAASGRDPYRALTYVLFPSLAFRKWLGMVTGLGLERTSILARRFRRGLDYQLAQSYESEEPQLEYTLCITPTSGWGGEEEETSAGNGEVGGDVVGGADGVPGSDARTTTGVMTNSTDEDNVGGYELYMAGDDEENDDEDDPTASDDGVTIPINPISRSHTGAGDRRSAKTRRKPTHDPAVYRAAGSSGGGEDEDEDDGILFSNPAAWNTMSIVLRDGGTMRFVKYVSRRARGGRWDVTGAFEVTAEDEDEDVA
ncbi:putative component of NuA3 histone acetyltransferase complex [Friedmanniomyces endolithicus]|uniref:Component of NuA3 histone acetyltransferase complex n=1 Tax=Friedmanniomyces endolithicus TaxID=329885 RepID=A0AAN6KTU4_9PEZI|nr:putative component of NuA3 histone acetyltransferase complex [Friedmanniomyces endolithicus]KAK0870036.1 putative component of NuA3 histone acetyltransferase complex [Friedmanniomyces endolithicus]KAK0920014.1 putative component of NuA3 histone acetyltransferase complex [Friedmanniomyces endolithicus]KAK1001837.1 putative component of NuA3 histone acetyltransferase complex [Friedmanniomyces endolithicus]KAK1014100.1 putative component of NuA3 histone acetyltransferase complex [Friedmanniomyc